MINVIDYNIGSGLFVALKYLREVDFSSLNSKLITIIFHIHIISEYFYIEAMHTRITPLS
jgi:hypothetical protein